MKSPLLSFAEFKGVILDWDGVIAETQLDFSHIRKRFYGGKRVPLLEGLATLSEAGRRECMQAICDEELRGPRISTPVPGAFEFVALLNERKIPWCVMSRNCRESIELAASTIGFELPPLSFGREAAHIKPDPRAFTDAAALLGVSPRECLAIGDFLYELIAARRAGVRCVLVNRRDEECEALADAVFPHLSDFVAAFAAGQDFVPWEYHEAAESAGRDALRVMHGRTVFFDTPLHAAALAQLERLLAHGLGAVSVPDRTVTARELRGTPALAPNMLARPLCEALSELFAARYPLVSFQTGECGEALSTFPNNNA